MPDLTSALLPRLLSHRLPGLDLGGRYVYPHYSGYSLLNLTASICQALGAPLPGAVPLEADALPASGKTFRKVVLLVVDGLGLEAFRRHLGTSGSVWAELLPGAALAPLTSLAPSTTSAVLTTLWTGASPLQHGIIGYEVWLREYGIVANMIVHAAATASGDVGSLKRSGFAPETFLPVTQLGIHLAAQGVKVHAWMPAALARSGLSTMQMAQAHIYPYRTISDLWISLADRLAEPTEERLYAYAYWPDLDTLSHVFGPQDDRLNADLELFSYAARRYFFDRLGPDGLKDTLFLLTADHGMISTIPQPHYDLRNHPHLAEMLHLQPTGETRLAYLYPRPGSEGEVQEYMEKAWPREFDFVHTRQAVASGLFGPGEATPTVLSRIGDLIAIARGQSYLWWANKENHLYGRHGGLSPEEMLVPLFSLMG
jgi:predicted AlkP superfamily pyrophosphatase or phosphodiesterase